MENGASDARQPTETPEPAPTRPGERGELLGTPDRPAPASALALLSPHPLCVAHTWWDKTATAPGGSGVRKGGQRGTIKPGAAAPACECLRRSGTKRWEHRSGEQQGAKGMDGTSIGGRRTSAVQRHGGLVRSGCEGRKGLLIRQVRGARRAWATTHSGQQHTVVGRTNTASG